MYIGFYIGIYIVARPGGRKKGCGEEYFEGPFPPKGPKRINQQEGKYRNLLEFIVLLNVFIGRMLMIGSPNSRHFR